MDTLRNFTDVLEKFGSKFGSLGDTEKIRKIFYEKFTKKVKRDLGRFIRRYFNEILFYFSETLGKLCEDIEKIFTTYYETLGDIYFVEILPT